jgi:hypothetical protein
MRRLSYLCDHRLDAALKSIKEIGSKGPLCPSEESSPEIVWFAWGRPDPVLDVFKARFRRSQGYSFFFDKERVIVRVPLRAEFVHHTRALPRHPIEEHLGSIL